MKDFEKLRIAVAGTGYVGLSIATLLAQHHKVTAVDVVPEKVELINNKKSPIQDEYIEKYLSEKELNLTATLDGRSAYKEADFVVIAAPTNYDPQKNFFDTHHIEDVIDLVLEVNPDAVMVIKSTVPVGYTKGIRELYLDKVKGILSELDYLDLSKDFSTQKERLEKLVIDTQKQLDVIERKMQVGDNRRQLIEQYTNLEHLDREIVEKLI